MFSVLFYLFDEARDREIWLMLYNLPSGVRQLINNYADPDWELSDMMLGLSHGWSHQCLYCGLSWLYWTSYMRFPVCSFHCEFMMDPDLHW